MSDNTNCNVMCNVYTMHYPYFYARRSSMGSSEKMRKLWKDPQWRAKTLVAMQEACNTSGHLERKRENARKMWSDPCHREKMRKLNQKRFGSILDRIRKKVRKTTTGCWLWTGGTSMGYGVTYNSRVRQNIFLH